MNPPRSSLHTAHMASLVQRWQQGDQAAATELVGREEQRLRDLAHRMLRSYPRVRDQVGTADVVLEACHRLLRALRQVTPTSMQHFYNLSSLQIGRELKDLARHFRRGPHLPLGEGAEPVAPGSDRQEVEELERWAALHEEVGRLPEQEREVFGLRHYEGLTWPAIAEVLHINEKTARTRWNSALISLQETLGGWTPPEEDAAE
jgi:RNA polymerase sigma factor (sigma-70 family)